MHRCQGTDGPHLMLRELAADPPQGYKVENRLSSIHVKKNRACQGKQRCDEGGKARPYPYLKLRELASGPLRVYACIVVKAPTDPAASPEAKGACSSPP